MQSTLMTSVIVESKKNSHKCKWSSCKGDHERKITYPNDGRVKKSGYRDKWIVAGMQPWVLYGKYKKRLTKEGKDYKTMTYEYKTQAHHLVPTSLIDNTTTLKDNAILISYDCDDNVNGMMLPQFKMDIPLHDLQAHLGNHPGAYMSPISKKLRQYEKDYDGICTDDISCNMAMQKGLKSVLDSLSNIARKKIINIKSEAKFWPLRTSALQEYKDAKKEYDKRLKLYKKR